MAEEGLTLVCHSSSALEWQTSVSPSNPLRYDKRTDFWQWSRAIRSGPDTGFDAKNGKMLRKHMRLLRGRLIRRLSGR